LLEWDDLIPSFEEVHNEALKAKKYLKPKSPVQRDHAAMNPYPNRDAYTAEKARA
jgi:hypothetical protein